MPAAARLTDTTSHGSPLGAGPGSSNVFVGRMPAWRALPGVVGPALEAAANAMSSLMSTPVMTPVDAAAQLAQIQTTFTQAAACAAVDGSPAAPASTSTALATLSATNVALTAAYTAAAAVPGGAAAAATAYTEGLKAAAAAAAGAAVTAIGGMTDLHTCPMPCGAAVHGPGVVTKGSASVFINKLPAVRQGDSVYEACGGADAIAIGSPTVFIGDAGSSAAAEAAEAQAAAVAAAQSAAVAAAQKQAALARAAAIVAYQNRSASASGKALCEVCAKSSAEA